MQIIFDTSRDSKLDIDAGIAAIQRYVEVYYGNEAVVPQVLPMPTTPAVAEPVKHQINVTTVASDTQSFQPGNLAAVAPEAVVAAASATAPVAPPVGAPVPPSVSQAPAPAPTAPVVSAAPSTSAPGVDVTGLPWDERIHAANAGKNADGRWRKKKGLNDAAYIGAVEAELRTRTVAAPAPAPAPVAAPPVVVPPPPVLTDVVVPPPPLAQAPAAPTAPVTQQLATPSASTVAQTAPQPPAAPPVPVAPDTSTFRGLMEWLTPLMTTGKLAFPTVTAAVQAHGLNVLSDMSQPQNAHLVPSVYAMLAASVK